MRAIHFVVALSLLLALAGMGTAQVDQQMPDQQPSMEAEPGISRARVEMGPVVQLGLPMSADVFVDGRFAMRIPAPAGGLSPMQRAQIIANRLNQAFEAGETWDTMLVSQVDGLWVLSMNARLIATADSNSARAYGISPGVLASRWARQTVVALGGQPQMIAMRLEPVPGRVAGVVEELPAEWAITPTRTVPLLNAATGMQVGTVTIGGPRDRLNAADAVVMHEYTQNGAIVRTFTPITGTAVTGDMVRAHGVGVVGIPAGAIPITGLRMGAEVSQMATQMGAQWNNLINQRMMGQNLHARADTRVVPLYSTDQGQVIGAAQVVGTARGIEQTQAVALTTVNDMMQFRATAAALPMPAQPTPRTDVVVSAIILVPEDAEMPITIPPGAPPEPPEEVPPDMAPPEPPVTPPGPPDAAPPSPPM